MDTDILEEHAPSSFRTDVLGAELAAIWAAYMEAGHSHPFNG
jgi:hypothetical protein